MNLFEILVVNAIVLVAIFMVLLLAMTFSKRDKSLPTLRKVETQKLRTQKNDFRAIREQIADDA
jgi:hypothetical protein